MSFFRSVAFATVCFFVSINAFASDPQELFDQLKNSKESFEVSGTICEQAARLDLAKVYPSPQYEVTTGIAYADHSRIIGELDVIVFETAAPRRAVLVGEVKCWRDLNGAMTKAMQQRARFLNMLQHRNGIHMYSTKTHQAYDVEAFKDIQSFITISQRGGEKSGFTQTLDYSLDELMNVRKELMTCQAHGPCPAP